MIFNLKEISNSCSEDEHRKRVRYQKLYIRLIQKCQKMTEEELSGYNEKHHILPKCMGGSNDMSNLVIMPARYHILAHLILTIIYPDNHKLFYALHATYHCSNGKNLDTKTSTRVLARIRELSVKSRSGDNHPVYGKNNKTVEEIQAAKLKYIGANNKRAKSIISPSGKIFGSISDASKEMNIPYDTLTKWLSGEISDHGWKYLDGEKTNFSNRNTAKSSKEVVGPDGVVYESIKCACAKNKIKYTTMRYWLSHRVKNCHGWKYKTESQSD